MSEEDTRYVISVLARDHAGIIADVSEALFEMGANLQAVSQTVVGDWFTMVACASFSDAVDESIIMPIYYYTRVVMNKPNIVRTYAPLGGEHWDTWDIK